jgi:hypothetical protein
MAHLKTVEKWLTYDFLPSGVPLQVDGVVPPLAARAQQTGWALPPLLWQMRQSGDVWAPVLATLAAYVLSGQPAGGGSIPPLAGAPADAVGAIYLPAAPEYVVNVSTDMPAFWVRVA